MKGKTIITLAAMALILAGCTKKDSGAAADTAAVAGGAQNQVAENMAQVEGNTGGKFKLALSGGINGSADSQDAGFCAQKSSVMAIFAVSLVDPKYGLEIGSAQGLPAKGTYKFSPDALKDWSGTLLDKTTGSSPDKWGKYTIKSGSVTVTSSSPDRVAGTYSFAAAQETGGADVKGTGEFEAGPAKQCMGQ